ncbi:hypothetical protein FVE85_9552 [Porphyridium purpureum]|uniref:Uncharacterized protein n=1 Tax=Porphyridium purpureum TaxID=35688 RepID=A0A5J4YLD1_PORPP|nr:hypothetical protein FVE85_9552 [Porphyridium purpureum]|eukprot:POR4877..scf261_15
MAGDAMVTRCRCVVLLLALLAVSYATGAARAQGSDFVAGEITSDVEGPVIIAQTNGSASDSLTFFLRPFANNDNVTDVNVITGEGQANTIISCAPDCDFNVATERGIGSGGYTVFNITVNFEFDYLPGLAVYTLEIFTSIRDGSPGSEPYTASFLALPRFDVLGFVILAPGTDRASPGSPDDPKIVSGELYSLDLGNYQDTLATPQYVMPVIGRYQAVASRFPYNDLLKQVVPVMGPPQNQTSDSDACPVAQQGGFDPATDDFPLDPGCGFKIFYSEATPDLDTLVLVINPYRVGMFNIEWEGNENVDINGMPFETLLRVTIASVPVPPTVSQFGRSYTFDYFGWEIFPWTLYNLVDPPRPSNDEMVGGFLSLGDPSQTMPEFQGSGLGGRLQVNANMSYTDLDAPLPSFQIYFLNLLGLTTVPSDAIEPGEALVPGMYAQYATTGVTPITQLPAANSQVRFSSSELCITGTLDNDDQRFNIIQFYVEFLLLDVASTSNNTCSKVIRAIRNNPDFGSLFGPMVPTSVSNSGRRRFLAGMDTSGRQVEADGVQIEMRAIVPAEGANRVRQDLDEYLDSDQFAMDVFVDPDWVRRGEGSTIETPSAVPTGTVDPGGASGGLPTWAIAVISVIAALLLILIIAVALFLILANKEEEDTESSYSSEGPALVPRPDDIMYQQAIVRDEYGRGEFSEPLEGEDFEMENGIRAEYPRIVA